MDIESTKETPRHKAPPQIHIHPTRALYQTGRKIQRVPALLRQEDSNCNAYDPKVVSFGPYHHGKPGLKACEEVKHFTLQMFVEGSDQTPEFYYTEILKRIPDVRNCYDQGSTDQYTDEEFAEMMLLDSCFLIFYMNIGPQKPHRRFFIYNHLGSLIVSLVNRDILLMENQIPFQILMLLINLRYVNGEEAVSKFLHQSIWGQYKIKKIKEQQIQDINEQQKQSPPLHLFQAFHRVLVWDFIPQTPVQTKEKEDIDQKKHVQTEEKEDIDLKKHHKTFRSAKDLKGKGIHFKPSCTKSLKAIHFNSFTFYGQLQLPTWFVSSLSKVFFLNMIAYELCPNNLTDMTVIAYINFMKSLIDSPADVKELREKRILLTSLGSDEDVVKLYKDLNTYGMANAYSFMGAKKKIQEHYDSKGKTWMAELIYTYFRSPWSIIAWIAGVFLLVLTVVQTYFTINPSD